MRILKIAAIILMFFIVIPTLIYASTWENTYGGPEQDYSSWAVQTPDGGFVIAGNTYSFGNGSDDLLLLKLDSEGNIVWQKTYGGGNREYATAIIQTSDGGFIVAGSTITYGISDLDFWVLKFDADFDITWQKYYAGSAHNTPYSIQETSDGGFIIAGANDFADSDIWILKIDVDGAVEWQNTYDREGYDDIAYSVKETPDGGYIVAGQTDMNDNMPGTTDIDILILKLDASGGLVWQKTYGGDSLDYARSMEKTSDGNCIILGETYSYGAGSKDLVLLKIVPEDGTVLWQKVYGGFSLESARTVKETKDGGFVLTGDTKSFGAGGYDGWILNLGSNGNIIWQKKYGGPDWEFFRYAQETSNGNFFITGNSYTNYDIYALKVNADGEIPGCQSFVDTDAVPVVSSMAPVSAAVVVKPLSPSSGDTSATPQDAYLAATYLCYDSSPDTAFIETGEITNASTSDWTTVALTNSFMSMVVVCTPAYDNTSPPMVVRVKDAIDNSFQLKMDRADGQSGDISGITVYYVVVEEGIYNSAEDGITMEAVKMLSTLTDRRGSWIGQSRGYLNEYVNPVVIGQVLSYNDPEFSVFWSCGSSKNNPASASAIRVGKHVGEDSLKSRHDETIGFIVIEAGSGSIGSLDYVVGLGADTVRGIPSGSGSGYNYSFNGLVSPTSAVVSQAAMDGGNGGWAILYGSNPISSGSIELSIDEDQMRDIERNHTTEQVSYIVFEKTGN